MFNDNTNNAGDYFQLCYDGNADGGTAPKTDDLRIDLIGHNNQTGLKAFRGNGTGWDPLTTTVDQLQGNDSLSTSPYSSTPHYIAEIKLDKIALALSQYTWVRIAAYNAGNSSGGVHVWPPSSRDVPDDYGYLDSSADATPESLGFGAMVILSSVAVIAGSAYRFRKRSRNISPV